MKYTTQELLLAAAVRKRVEEMRVGRSLYMSDEQRAAFMTSPADELIAEAVMELEQFLRRAQQDLRQRQICASAIKCM